jgi:hypothetical protein
MIESRAGPSRLSSVGPATTKTTTSARIPPDHNSPAVPGPMPPSCQRNTSKPSCSAWLPRTSAAKTHLATAIGIQAIEHHRKRVRFFSTVELVNALEQEKLQGKPGQIAARLAHSDLVILDELGYLPSSASGGALLFHLFEQALRARQRHHHHQPQLRRVGDRVRRPEDDDRTTRSSHPPLPHSRNR